MTQQFFERPIGEASHTALEVQKLPIEKKESYRWIEAYQQTIALSPDGAQVVNVCKREGDFYEMFAMAQEKPNTFGRRLKAKERLENSRLISLAMTNSMRVKPPYRFVFAPSH